MADQEAASVNSGDFISDIMDFVSGIFDSGSQATIIYLLVMAVVLYFITNSLLRLFSTFMVIAGIVCSYLWYTGQITTNDIVVFFDTVFTRIGLKDLLGNISSGSSSGDGSGQSIGGLVQSFMKDINNFILGLLK